MVSYVIERPRSVSEAARNSSRVQSRPLRVLMAHNRYLERGGEDSVTAAEAGVLRANGCTVELYHRDNSEIEAMGAAMAGLSSLWSRKTYRAVRALLKEQRYDIVHVQNFFPLISPAIYDAARAEGVPVVQTIHNYRLICPGGLLLRDGEICERCVGKTVPWPGVVHGCYRNSRAASAAVATMISAHKVAQTWRAKVDRFIALTEFSRSKLVQGGLPAEKIVVKPNFVDPDPGLRTMNRTYFLYIGRLSREKGIGPLIEAWKRLGVSQQLLVVGDGPEAAALKRRYAHLPTVDFLGHKQPEEIYELLSGAIALCFPSLCYENHPRTIIEAYSVGTPVIAYRHGAMAEVIEDCETGFLAEPMNAQALVEKVRHAAIDRPEMIRMGVQARKVYEDHFTGEKNFEQLYSIYEDTRRAHRSLS